MDDFDGFYRAEADRLARALALAVGDLDLDQEAVDEAMVRAYQRWRKVGRYDSPAGWVYRVSLNWARNRLRNRRREVLTDATGDRPYWHDVDPDLEAALNALSIDARAVVVLRYLLGWSTVETATALGVSQGTVKSRLSRALERLEGLLEER
ncbi:MAG: sigma-70 family RNA polymerase sigma factor [Actinomycetota bacterium]